MSHTPAPWIIKDDPQDTTQILAGGVRVADVWATDLPGGMDNARLIAAAPDLLTALADAVVNIAAMHRDGDDTAPHDEEEFCVYCQWMRNARALLRAVEGD